MMLTQPGLPGNRRVLASDALRMWRRRRWLSQPDLAYLLGVHGQTVNRWERTLYAIPPYLELALERLDDLYDWSPDGPTDKHGKRV